MEPITASAARLAGTSLLRLQSDERLARLAALDNHPAFEAVVRRYRPELLRSARRILSEGRAEDAVQQALLKAHRALLRNGPPEKLRPWLHRITLNSALDLVSQDSPDALPEAEELGGSEGVAETHERSERLRETVSAIQGLPDTQRRAIVARELEGRSHDEIASELGLSAGAARQLISRARAGVRSAATALTPTGLLERMIATGGSESGRPIAEIATGGAAGGAAAKLAVAAIVTGGVVGGAALAPLDEDDGKRKIAAGKTAPGSASSQASGAGADSVGLDGTSSSGAPESESSNSGPNRGRGSDDKKDGDDSSEPGDGEDGGGDSSGSGSSGSGLSGSGSSGSGSSGSGSSGSGSSGSGSSGSGSSGSSSSDSGSSGSGSSGSSSSGSGSSGSGSVPSGSGSSGSGSSGGGSDDVPEAPEPDELDPSDVD